MSIVEHALRALKAVEQITRPPQRPPFSDVDTVHDGAEQLAEREAEEEVFEPHSSAAPAAAADLPAGVELLPPVPPAGLPLADWLEPAVWEALADHEPECADGPICCCGKWLPDWQAWREHVGKPIAEHIAQSIQDYPTN